MRLSKLSRKQKIIRNLLVTTLAYFLMMWYQGFPVRSYEALLQRAAGAYLIEKPVELLYVYEEKSFVYGLADGRLLRIFHGKNPFYGMQLNAQLLYPEETRYVVSYDTHDFSRYDKEESVVPLRYEAMLIGLLDEAATAELDIQLVFHEPDSPVWAETSREVVTITGVREGEYNLRFPTVEDGRNGFGVNANLLELRLYDEEGTLLEMKDYEADETF